MKLKILSKKMRDNFNKIINKNPILIIALITIIAIFLRLILFHVQSGDYKCFLQQWFDYFKTHEGLKGLANYPGDYNAPYMTLLALLSYLPGNSLYLIKGLSVLFDFSLAISAILLFKELKVKNKSSIIIYALIILAPQVILNSSMWGQCDSIYTTFIILSLLFLLKEKYSLSFIMLGIAFAFKLQFIFILPLYIILFFTKKNFSAFNFLLIPLMNLILQIPAIIFGKPFKECLTVYLNQTSTYKDSLVLNYPNIYNLIEKFPLNLDIIYKIGIIFSFSICCFLLIYCVLKKIKWNQEKIMALGLVIVVLMVYFLPGMHERYAYVGEMLSIIYLIAYKKHYFLIILMNIIALLMYMNFLTVFHFPYMLLLSIIYGVVIIITLKNILKSLIDS